MSDAAFRDLVRRARQGDPEAKGALPAMRERLGLTGSRQPSTKHPAVLAERAARKAFRVHARACYVDGCNECAALGQAVFSARDARREMERDR